MTPAASPEREVSERRGGSYHCCSACALPRLRGAAGIGGSLDRRRLASLAAFILSIAAGPSGTARAAPPAAKKTLERPRRHALYLELLGKGGPWGLGYDYQLGRRLAAGATVSFAPLGRQQLFSASPYLAAYPVRGERHGWFLQAGPQLLHLRTPSPVPEWKGTHSSSFGAELSSGYEYRANVLLRAYAMAAAGKGGLAPWVGFTLGWTF